MHCNQSEAVLASVLPPLLVTEFLFGFLANGLALWIFCCYLRPWKSSTVLLFNLAMSDFFLDIALPLRAIYYKSGMKWKFDGLLCNICLFMLALNRSGSSFFLMAIAVDRYMRVVHPHHRINSLSVQKAMLGALGLWLVSVSMTAHLLTLQLERKTCDSFLVNEMPLGTKTWHKFTFLFCFYMPLLIILYCTINIIGQVRGRQLAQQAKFRKALYFIIVVVVLFIICFLPSNITLLLFWISNSVKPHDCASGERMVLAFHITITLTYLNSILDPVVYYFSSPAIKNICRKVLRLAQTETAESPERKTRETCSQALDKL